MKTYEIACPICAQQPGEQCRTVDGHYMSTPHEERITAALMESGEREFTDSQIERAIEATELI